MQRWVPTQFFTDAVAPEVEEAMAEVVSDFHPLGFIAMARSLAETDTAALLRTVEVPTLLLWGVDDQRSPLTIAAQFRDAIPQAEFAVLADAGHVSNMEQPEAFNACVRRFCLANLSA